MVQIKNTYKSGLRTEAMHLKSGNVIMTDAPVDNNGKGEAFSPSDLVCAALASCMMTIMGIVAEREKIDMEGLDAEVVKVMVSNPRKISEVHINFTLPFAKIKNLTDKQKEVLKRAALTCPVALSLHPEIKQEVKFNF